MTMKNGLMLSPTALSVSRTGDVISPEPPPGKMTTPDERLHWDYICKHLRQAGVEHSTLGYAIERTVTTYLKLEKAEARCEKDGRYQISKTGWATPTPWSDDEKRYTMELMQWLPKIGMTLPALAKARKDMGEKGAQDDLFTDLVGHAVGSPQRSSMN